MGESEGVFSVVDVETTGFSPLTGNRVIEIAIIRVGDDGTSLDEYATLVNPGRPVGATESHGIDDRALASAPTFDEIVGDVLDRLEGRIVVGHNVRFDRDFLAAELSAAGVFLPTMPMLCTLRLAHRLHPDRPSYRIAACCSAVGLEHTRPHEALEEARATVGLLRHFMDEATGEGIGVDELIEGELRFPKAWPAIPPSGRAVPRPAGEPFEEPADFLPRLAASRVGAPRDESLASYIDLLDRALEDRHVTDAESLALLQTAETWGIAPGQVQEAHRDYLRSIVVAALADGWVTSAERADLHRVAALLRLEVGVVDTLLSEVAEEAE